MHSSEFQDGNGNCNFWGNKFSRVTRLPVTILTQTVVFPGGRRSAHGYPTCGTESRIVNRRIPRIAVLESPENPQREWGLVLKPQPHIQGKNMNKKKWPQNCRIKHFGSYLSRFLFRFLPCMWGAGVTRAFLREATR